MSGQEWLLDCLTQYFRGPLWVNPVATFIDENCQHFEDDGESTFEQTRIHKEFRELVEKLLEAQLAELGVSSQDFLKACQNTQNRELFALVTECVLALDDFVTFKAMMAKRNAELELESLRALQMGGFFGPGDDSDAEAMMIAAAIAASIADMDVLRLQAEVEQRQLEHVLVITLALENERARTAQEAAKDEKEKAELEKAHQANVAAITAAHTARLVEAAGTFAEAAASPAAAAAAVQKELEESARAAPAAGKPVAVKAVVGTPSGGTTAPAGKAELVLRSALAPPTPSLEPAHVDALAPLLATGRTAPPLGAKPLPPAPAGPKPITAAVPPAPPAKPDELAQRAEYLKQQRDRLLAMRKEQREAEVASAARPGSAGGRPAASGAAPAGEKLTEEQKQLRLALAKRFKEDLLQETRDAAKRAGK